MTFGLMILITAVVVVIATSLLKSVNFSTKTKSLIAVIVSTIAGGVAAFIESGGWEAFNDAGLIGTVLMVYGLATAIYQFILPKEVDEKLENILVHPKTHEVPAQHTPGQFNDAA